MLSVVGWIAVLFKFLFGTAGRSNCFFCNTLTELTQKLHILQFMKPEKRADLVISLSNKILAIMAIVTYPNIEAASWDAYDMSIAGLHLITPKPAAILFYNLLLSCIKGRVHREKINNSFSGIQLLSKKKRRETIK